VNLKCPRAIDCPVRQLLRSANDVDPLELEYASMKSSLERPHEKAMYLPREKHDTTTIKVARYLRDRTLHKFGCFTAIGSAEFDALTSGMPNFVRSRANIGPNRYSRLVDVSVPPGRTFKTIHTELSLPMPEMGIISHTFRMNISWQIG